MSTCYQLHSRKAKAQKVLKDSPNHTENREISQYTVETGSHGVVSSQYN